MTSQSDIVCANCRAPNHSTARACAHCGAALPGKKLGDDATVRWLLPVGRSWVAIVAGYLGLFAILCFPAPIALGFGIAAVLHLKANPELHGMGRAVFGIVMGALGTISMVVALIASIAESS